MDKFTKDKFYNQLRTRLTTPKEPKLTGEEILKRLLQKKELR
jgi:hypothetical protein